MKKSLKERFSRESLNTREAAWLAGFSVIAIPLFTYTMGTKESPFYHTMSVIGNKTEYRLDFILWGIFTGLSLSFFIARLFVLKSFKHKRARVLLIWSLIFLVLTVLIPFLEHLPIMSKLHNLMAVAFGVSLTASLYLFIKHLREENQKIYSWSMFMMLSIIGGSLLMLLLFGMTGIFEIFFFITLSLFLALLNFKLGVNKVRK